MDIQDITEQDKHAYNAVVSHPLQSYEWGEFRKRTGVKVIRKGFFENNKLISAFQLTIHPLSHTPWTIGYLPKGDLPTAEVIGELQKIGREEKCVFIQLEPNVKAASEKTRSDNITLSSRLSALNLKSAAHPLFTQYTFVLDLTKPEDEILKNMHHKARYNIRVAQKRGVKISEDDSEKAFEEYLRLTKETTTRQRFYAHTEKYHRLMWQTLGLQNTQYKIPETIHLSAHLLTATYEGQILTTWILFVFKDTLYYPYGASSSQHRDVMASNLMMWEAIKFGKKLGLKKFDMWGSLGPNPNPKDSWYGFHNFKEKYGPEHIEFIGSYDLIINSLLYQGYRIADKGRWLMLRMKKSTKAS